MGLLIVLIGVVLVLVYFISKQVRDMKRDQKINTQDLLALKDKLAKFEHVLGVHAQVLQNGGARHSVHEDEEPPEFDPSSFQNATEDNEPEDVIQLDDHLEEEDNTTENAEDVINTLDLTEDTGDYEVVGSDEPLESEQSEPDIMVEDITVDEVNTSAQDTSEQDTSEQDTSAQDTSEQAQETAEETSKDESSKNMEEISNQGEDTSESGQVSSNSDSEPTKRRRRARQPSEKAAQFDEGHQMENMGTMYEVYVDGKNRKRWRKLQTV